MRIFSDRRRDSRARILDSVVVHMHNVVVKAHSYNILMRSGSLFCKAWAMATYRDQRTPCPPSMTKAPPEGYDESSIPTIPERLAHDNTTGKRIRFWPFSWTMGSDML